jgi:hypothetical protein
MVLSQLKRRFPEEAQAHAQAALSLGVMVAAGPDGRWRVRAGGAELVAEADRAIDPALLREAIATGARVVLEAAPGAPPVIAGVLATARALTIDRTGAVEAEVRRLALTATEEALLRGPGAFVRLKVDEVELYGKRVVSRARELCRILGRMVKIN